MPYYKKDISALVKDIAKILNGTVILGQEENLINDVCTLDNPNKEGVAVYKGVRRELRKILQNVGGRLGCLVVKGHDFREVNAKEVVTHKMPSIISVDNPEVSLVKLLNYFYEYKPCLYNTVDSDNCRVDETAKVGDGSKIGDNVVIMRNCTIGKDVEIHPNVVLYEGVTVMDGSLIQSGAVVREFCRIGSNCMIGANTTIGGDGFGYVLEDGNLLPVPQVGTVIIEDNVHIGSNCCIDRGTIDDTVIGSGTKIDNLVQIGHNVRIGKNCILCGQVGIAGSCIIGDGVVLGGGVGVADHTYVASGCRFAARSGLMGRYSESGDYAGCPAVPAKQWLRQVANFRKE